MTLVSIITPSFNQAPFLEQTLRSVLDQAYPRIEYFVIDGASTDGSLEIIRKYASRLAGWLSEKDHGQAEAINKGLALAHGDIVAWLNSDDYYLPGAIASAVEVFEANPDAALVYGDMLAVDESGRTINRFKYRQLGCEELLCFQIIGQPAVFMRRAALEKSGGLDPSFHFLLDHRLWISMTGWGTMVHVDQTWAAARYHAGAKNRLKAAEFGGEARRILAWAAGEPALAPTVARLGRKARASVHRVDARYLLDGGRPAEALSAWIHAFLLHPPTALARLNLLVSAVLHLSGLGGLRIAILGWRQSLLEKRK
jgi:hypothetical protein